jgi:catechol 2,3-dioxygenase-like lactoylglutathione lyase family enzyme
MQLGPIKRLIFHVGDMAASKRFYVDLLELKVLYNYDENWYCFDTGQCQLCLSVWRPAAADGEALRNDEDTICFEVPDVPAAREALLAKGIRVGEVEEVGENAWVAKFRDPDGRMLMLESVG